MRILSVTLENFRIHEHLTVEFDTGINLLIGRNGAGKSSILEAIGFALFNSDLRVKGNKLAVRHGAKSAGIEVRFIGNDDNEYRVERKIGSVNRWQLFFGDEKSPRYQGAEDLVPRLRELVGVAKNEKRLFSDVICAVQNRFVDIFAGTKQQREDTFNLLFDTDIYRDLYKHFTGDESIERKYQFDQERLAGELSAMEESRIDRTAVLEEKKGFEEELVEVQKKSREQNDSMAKLKLLIADVNTSRKELSDLELQREHLYKERHSKQNHLEESQTAVTRAREAAELITAHESAFLRYNELAQARSGLEEKLKGESSVRQSVETKQNRTAHIDLELERCDSERKSHIQTEETLAKQSAERIAELQNCNTEREQLERRCGEIIARGKAAAVPMGRYDEELARFKEVEKESETVFANAQRLREMLETSADLVVQKESTLLRLQELTSFDSNLKQLLAQKKEHEIELRELDRAESELSGGFCPLLKEQCGNLTQKSAPGTYFQSRRTAIGDAIRTLESQIVPLENVPAELSESKEKLAVIDEKLRQSEQTKAELVQNEEKLRHAGDMKSLLLEKMALIEPDEPIDSILEYEERRNYLSTLREQIGTEYRLVNDQISPLAQKSDTLTSEIESLEQQKKVLESQKTALVKKRESLLSEQTLLKQQLESEITELSTFATLRTQLESVQSEQKTHEEGYRIYLEKRELAATLETVEQRVVALTAEIVQTTELLHTVEEKISHFNREELAQKSESLAVQEKELAQEIATVHEQLVLKRESIKRCDEQLELAKQQGDKIDRLLSEQKTVARKLELTALFRSNLRDMGRFVASGIVEDIASDATVHFHRITGRGERIEWVVNDSEKYTVFLVSGENGEFRREFSVLSGGEQVAVALALRTAMARELASGDFAIFDEPTVNLDTERRTALAESLKSMLGTMEQTLIVTHDDVFREMAQRTIEL